MQLRMPELFRQECYVNGRWTAAKSGAVIEVTNPVDGSVVGTVPNFGAEETAQAVADAEAAFADWRSRTARERAALLSRWHGLVLENIDDLALILTMEQGKPLAEAKGEIGLGAEYIQWYAEECRRASGEVPVAPHRGRQPVTVKEPVGVVAAITPWNFPMSMIPRKAAPGMAVGCPVIVKPASQTPFSALALAELAHRAGIPAGVFSVITGDSRAIGGELTSNDKVRKLSFTGSTAVGRKLMAQCADNVKKLSLELGGNAPFIVFDDADIDAAAGAALGCKFRNAGQTCICANRMLVQDSVYDAFVEKLAAKVKNGLILGSGIAQGTTMGPMIDDKAVDFMDTLVADATSKGAKIVTGGKRSEVGARFFEPTILTDVNTDMKVFREEIFGPIAPIVRFSDEAEALAMANDSEYGLASYLFSRDIGRIWRVSRGLEFGMVGVNEVALASGEVPFGGVKQSGLGREGAHEGLEEYLETKLILLGGLDA